MKMPNNWHMKVSMLTQITTNLLILRPMEDHLQVVIKLYEGAKY